LPPPVFRSDIMKLDDLKPGMELPGTVLNVVDFGAFIDIGNADSSLVHISRLANRYIADPHDVVSIGDVLKVWVIDVDTQRRRVSLTAIPPGSEVPRKEWPQPTKQRPFTERQPQRVRPPKHRQATTAKQPSRKPAAPITKEMVKGTEPMRSFSDLLQYYEVKDETSNDQPPED
jgi:uncharacterized protein